MGQPAIKKSSLSSFHLSCWVLALLAFLQLSAIGLALAIRQQQPAQVEKQIITEYVSVPAESRPVTSAPPVTFTPAPIPPSPAALIPPQVTEVAPSIADPVVERLVSEARSARVAGDNLNAITKLEEALHTTPDEPNTLYEFAGTFEAMGVYDKAADYYLKVYQLGPVRAGSLWKKSGAKLEAGFVPDTKGLASLGVVRTMPPREVDEGTRHGVMIPIAVSPGRDFDPSLLQTKVHFYERRKGKVERALVSLDGAEWLSEPLDWVDGEELVEIWYVIPPIDSQEQQLYGEREYYGYLAELYYNNELMDVRFHPRTLLNETKDQRSSFEPLHDPMLDGLEEFLPQDYHPGDPLLPPLPSY